MRTALAGILSGALYVLGFPHFAIAPAAWVALVPLVYQLSRATFRQGLAGGALMGVVCHIGLVYWTAAAMARYGGLSAPVSLAVLLTLVAYLTLFTMLFGGLTVWAWRLGGWRAPVLIPFLWVGLELLRNHPWGGFPWCLLGYSQVGVLPIIQIASVTGIYGVSLLVASVNAVIAYSLTAPGVKRASAVAAPVAVLAAAVIAFGYRRLSEPLPEPTYPVAAVQGSVLQERKWDPAHAPSIVADQIRLSLWAAERGARLIVWPESSTPFHFDEAPAVAEDMKGFARRSGVYLLFGSDDYEPGTDAVTAYNGAKLITPDGEVTLRYHKNILVPFAEYVPLRRLIPFVDSLMEGGSDFTPGSGIRLASVERRPVGAFICYEAIYPDLVRRFVLEGAGLLVNLTNDAWFGRTSAPYQHLNMAVARAVETRRYLVRAANTGVSAIVDPCGRVLKQSDLFTQEVVNGKVSFLTEETLFVRYGNRVGHAAAVLTVLFAVTGIFFPYKIGDGLDSCRVRNRKESS